MIRRQVLLVWLIIVLTVALAGKDKDKDKDKTKEEYTLTDLGTLGGTESFAYAINDSGDIVGSARLAGDLSTHAVLYRRGERIDLFPLNSESVKTVGPSSISNTGRVASGVLSRGIYVPALFDIRTGETTLLGTLGGVWADADFNGVAMAVNNNGQAVGYSYLDGITRHAFLYSKGILTDLGSLGGSSYAFDINDAGTIVGAFDTPSGISAFVYSQGTMTELHPFGGNNQSVARAVNNKGWIAGEADRTVETDRQTHAFIYSRGRTTDLGTLDGGRYSSPFDINEKGTVVGVADRPYRTTCWDFYTGRFVP